IAPGNINAHASVVTIVLTRHMVLVVGSSNFRFAHTDSTSLQLIEHLRKCMLQLQGFLDFVGAYVWIFSVLQKARNLMLANEPDESLGVRLPVHRKAFEVFEYCPNAGSAE